MENDCSFSGDCRALLKSHRDVLAKLESIERRLFKDNGAVSIQTRLDRHEQVLRLMLWAVGVIGGTFLVGLTGGMVVIVRELIGRGIL